jgi:DNA primase large subunit
MGPHIGQLIKEQLELSGMKKTEFARRINKTSQNVYAIFERSSIDSALMANISEILNFNFFEALAMEIDHKRGGCRDTKKIQQNTKVKMYLLQN